MSNYLLKDENDNLFYFFYRNGICMKNLRKETENYKLILENIPDDFNVQICSDGSIFIIAQEKNGDIVTLTGNPEQWHKTTVLKSRMGNSYDKNFALVNISDYISVFYIVEYKGKNLLSHQIIHDNDSVPNVIDYIDDPCFYTIKDCNGDIFVFYNSNFYDHKLGYKKYVWQKKEWDEFCVVSDGKILDAIYTRDEYIYILIELNGQILLKSIGFADFTNERLEQETIVLTGTSAITNPVLMWEREELWLVWMENGEIFAKNSKTRGESFLNTTRFVVGRDAQIELFNIKLANDGLCANRCFGYLSNLKPQLYLYQGLYSFSRKSTTSDFSANNQKPKAEIEFSKVIIRIENLEGEMKKINQQLKTLHTQMNENKKEVSKMRLSKSVKAEKSDKANEISEINAEK